MAKLKKLSKKAGKELLDHIDHEGGIGEYFGSYTSGEEYNGTELEPLIKAFITASEALQAKLNEYEE